MKSGRKRKACPREPSGRPSRAARDGGTDEAQRIREWLAGSGDPALTSYPLGVLFANRAITLAQHSAGVRYGFLFAVALRRPNQAALAYDGAGPLSADWGEAALEGMTENFNAARRALVNLGPRTKTAVENLVVYERAPRWMRPVTPRQSDVIDAQLVLDGLDILAGAFGYIGGQPY